MTSLLFREYSKRLVRFLDGFDWSTIVPLAENLREALRTRKSVYLCGNGGSAANAIHLANDYLYGIGKKTGVTLKVEALPANPSVLTCLANDVGYAEVFAQQLKTKGEEGDTLIVLSGSGESPNLVRALEVAHGLSMKTFALVGYSGGRCKELADHAIHFDIQDMQICEDLQQIVGHMLMQCLAEG
ncbi:MAG: SIS domain-containing protein [Spirochaetia bacterium]|jgi:D-sedoheptulose 7-phosphate isomerase